MGWAEAEVSLTLVSDRAMARLNRETFGRRGPTNVIAFPMDRPEEAGGAQSPGEISDSGPPLVLGEVIVSVETTRRQAAATGWPWEELFDFYLIHGILHLAGYDHDTPAADAAMTARSWELLEMIRGEDLG